MHQARAAATNLFNADPGLKRPENRHFGSLIAENRKRTFATVS
jgi:hypothetical protein